MSLRCEQLTTLIPPALKAHMKRLARERGITLSYFVRRHLEASFAVKAKSKPRAKKPVGNDKAMQVAVNAFVTALSRAMKSKKAA